MRKTFLATCATVLVPFLGFAHEGHGSSDGFTISHYFVEPEHAIYTWTFLMVLAAISFYSARKKYRRNG